MKKIFLLIIIFYTVCVSAQTGNKIYLTDKWEFRKSGDENWMPAKVPGCVHTDLQYNGIIPDPFAGNNESSLQWIEKEDWEYKINFSVDDAVLKKQAIDLVFEGLDTYAKIHLNESLIISADNMFRIWKCDVKKYLKQGDNTIKIIFRSPVKETEKYLNQTPKLPGGERVFTRKAAYQYGWDFAPRFVICGIWRNVYLSAWDYFEINNANIRTVRFDNNIAVLNASLEIISLENTELLVSITDESSGKKILYKNENIAEGINNINIEFDIDKPKLWWCNGLGEPYLYKFYIEATDNKERWNNLEVRTGIRKIELIREKVDNGESFYFKLNGVPVFMKGANYIPQDVFLASVSKDKYVKIVDNAVKSNINMLRVWGGGVYEDDEFYRQCDEKGILVWQDFMFACGMYPGDDAFIENVKQEVSDNIKRLRVHPCIALWCGNNEIDKSWNNWGWQKEFGYSKDKTLKIRNDYTILFEKIIPDLLGQLSESTSYIPSSPKYGWGRTESLKEGDSHYWGVWWGSEPFEVYNKKVGRFMSEYGFQSLPDMKTIKSFNPEGNFKTTDELKSDAMLAHQKHPKGYELINEYMQREYPVPMEVENYIYISQLLQAYGIKEAIEAHRRAKPYCMGSLYWQFNDCWPGITWSGIDYFGRWKALQYFVKEAYKNILVSFAEENGKIQVYVVSDRLKSVKGKLTLQLMDFYGKVLSDEDKDINVKENSSNVYYEINKNSLIGGNQINKIFLLARFYGGDGSYYENIKYFTPVKDLLIPQAPPLRIRVAGIDKAEEIYFTDVSVLVKNLYLSFDETSGETLSNYFDLIPGDNSYIKLNTNLKVDNPGLFDKIKMKTLNEALKK